MSFKVDCRTPRIDESHFNEIPVVDNNTYLSVLIDDCGDIKPLQTQLKVKAKQLKQQIGFI